MAYHWASMKARNWNGTFNMLLKSSWQIYGVAFIYFEFCINRWKQSEVLHAVFIELHRF